MHRILIGALLAPLAAAIWPMPSRYTSGSNVLWFDKDVRVTYQGPHSVCTDPPPTDYIQSVLKKLRLKTSNYPFANLQTGGPAGAFGASVIETAVNGTFDTILNKNFVPWKFHPRMTDFEPSSTANKTNVGSIVLHQNQTDLGNLSRPLDGQIDESYDLELTKDGQATITAASELGLARGLNTFTQLFYAHSNGGAYTTLAPVSISDMPKFAHRGLNMDVSRNYYTVADIERTIDALAYNKFNRLHIHITDAQSWPLVIPSLPELSDKGAYAKGLVYTPSQVQGIQRYGALRGVEVYLEIDMPGHTSSIAFSHPELIAAFNVQPNWDDVAAEPPSGTLKLNSTAVYDFLGKLFDDILPRVSQYTSYFSTGGDEVKYEAYLYDDTVNSNSTAVLQPLIQKFFDFTYKHVTGAGLTQIVWEEMLLMYNVSLPKDVIVQSWQSDAAVAAIANSGHRAISGNYEYWYMDCGHGQWINFKPGPDSQANFPYQDYCAPLHNWRVMYSYDPLSGVPANATDLVIGGEASIWSEQTDGVSLDSVIWPRLAAAGEVLWGGAKDPATGQNRSQVEAAPRLSEMRERLVARGVHAAVIQMPFCTQNGSQCTFPDS